MSWITHRVGKRIRQTDLYWRYVANARPWWAYRCYRHVARTSELMRLNENLKRTGIAITTVTALFRDTLLFDELDVAVRELQLLNANQVEEARAKRETEGFKQYLLDLLGPRPVLDPNSIFVRIAVAPVVIELVNAYFGMMTRLRYYNVWLNFASGGQSRNSQLWHRDPEDRYILKMFIHLSDVDDGSGPFFYAPGTHSYGRIRRQPESFGEPGTTARRSNDKQMAVVVPEDKWVKAIGPQGTIVFADTRGYHKGGLARTKDRLVYNCMYTSQATTRGEYFDRRPGCHRPTDQAVAFALGF